MKTLSIDIETYSNQNLAKTGVYRYVESPVFQILLFSYSVDSGPVQLVDLACGEEIPAEVLSALTDDSVIKWAFNAGFERICLSRHLGYPTGDYLDPESWRCSMIWAATMGLPLSLEGVGAVLGLEKQKLTEGKELIKYFCQPCAPTKTNGQRTRNLPAHAPDKWLAFKKYNIRDVETEMSIQARLAKYPVPDSVWDEYHIDQEINDRGVALDMELVRQAIQMDGRSRSELTQAMKDLTALENPNSVQQMKGWLSLNGMETDTLGKKAVAEMLKTAPPELQTVLTLRQQLAKSSVKKYQAMETAVCADGRARGMFQFYGANRTGRWAGRIIQMQNLPQNHLDDLAEARGLVRCGDFEGVEMLYEDVPDTLSQLIRTAFVPQDDRKLIVADFSAIEARVIAWLAGEEWRQKVFAEGKDIYCASASQMFGVPVEKHGINGHLRQKGKIAELALGYGGSVGALKAMGALEMGLSEEELPPLVDAWRQANPNITKLWWDVDRAAMEAVRFKHTNETHGITFSCRSGMLFITLPSGRQLAYVKPKIGTNKFGGDCITYEGVGGTKKWERLDSYGPKFVENIVQATARDILCYAMQTLRCCSIVMHEQLEAYQAFLSAKAYQSYVIQRRASKNITATLKESRPMLEITPQDLDANPYLLCTPDATYDLRLGMAGAREHSPEDFITKTTTVSPGDRGKQIWLDCLDTIFCGDRELIDYVQMICGLAAIGKVEVEALIIAYGCGRNGKSTFWNSVSRVLGLYSGNISADTLTFGCRRNVKPEMAEVKGKRLLIAAEMQEGARLNDSTVKQLCSTDDIFAEKKYKDPFSFSPSHSLVLYTNHLPKVSASDDGTWRRLIVIPFNAKIEGKSDIKNYGDYLYQNAGESILAWVIEGAKKVIDLGYKFPVPATVQKAIDDYRSQNDWFGNFLDEKCEVGNAYRESSSALYQAYRNHCIQKPLLSNLN